MPFITATFVQKIQERNDPDSPLFSEYTEGDLIPGDPFMVPNQLGIKPPPAPPFEWAANWAEATELGAQGIIPPSNTLAAAKSAMEATLLTVTSATPAHTGLQAGFMAFAAAYIAGTPPNQAITIPPPGPGPDFASIDGMGMNSETNGPWINAAGMVIMDWFSQGKAFWLPYMVPVTTWL
tara:strand:- start:69 stop:608 length:540 start_codon:yes stop_codon:yes gene_type:complete